MQIKIITNPLDKTEIEIREVDYTYQSVGALFDTLDVGDRMDFFPVVSGGRVEWDYVHSIDDEVIFVADLQGKASGLVAGAVLIGLSFIPGIGQVMQAALISAGIGSLVGGVMGYLMPTPHVPTPDGTDNTPTYSWSGVQNIIGEGTTMPLVFGKHRVGGAIVEAFISGDRESGLSEKKYLNVISALSEGEIDSVVPGSIQLNKKDIELYGDIKHQVRTGTWDQTAMNGFSKIVRHHSLSRAVLKCNKPYIYKTNGVVDSAVLDVSFNALYKMDGENLTKNTVKFDIEYILYEKRNDIPWTKHGTLVATAESRSQVEFRYNLAPLPTRDQYLIRVTRRTPDATKVTEACDANLAAVSEVENASLRYPHTALLGMQILATDQLSGAMPSITADVKGLKFRDVRDLEKAPAWTDNHANIIFGALTDHRFGLGRWFNEGMVDIESLKALADYCDEEATYKYWDSAIGAWKTKKEKRHAFNMVLDQPMKASEFIEMVCTSCRAMPYWSGDKLKFAIDRPSEPAQLFSMGNIIADSFEETYYGMLDVPNQIEATFYDEEDDFNRHTVVAVDKARMDEPTFSRQIQIKGTTKMSRIKRDTMFALKKARALGTSITFSAGVDAVVVEPGDVFLFQHHTPEYGLAGGRIKKVLQSSVLLDTPAEVEQGVQYCLRIRRRDNTQKVYNLVAEVSGETREIKLNEIPQCAVGDVYAFGMIKKEAKPYRVTSITKKTDNTVEISGEVYNESVYTEDDSIEVEDVRYSSLGITQRYELDGTAEAPIPIKLADNPAVQTSHYDQPPYVDQIELAESVEVVNQQVVSNIHIDFAPVSMPDNSLAKIVRYEILWSTDAKNWSGERAIGSKHVLRNMPIGKKIYILVRPWTQYGVTNDIDVSDSRLKWDITPTGEPPVPDNVQEFYVTQVGRDLKFTWLPVENTVIDRYEVRLGDWALGQKVGFTKNGHLTIPVKGIGKKKYFIKARNTSGVWSYLPSIYEVDVVSPPAQNILLRLDQRKNEWPGAMKNMERMIEGGLRLPPGIKYGRYLTPLIRHGAMVRARSSVDIQLASVAFDKTIWENAFGAWDDRNGPWEILADLDNIETNLEISYSTGLTDNFIDVFRLDGNPLSEKGRTPCISKDLVYDEGCFHRGISQGVHTGLAYDISLPDAYTLRLRHTVGENPETGIVFTLGNDTGRLHIVAFPTGEFWLWDMSQQISVSLSPIQPKDDLAFGVTSNQSGQFTFFVHNMTEGESGSNSGQLNFSKPTQISVGA